jgi:hypothetical protein
MEREVRGQSGGLGEWPERALGQAPWHAPEKKAEKILLLSHASDKN